VQRGSNPLNRCACAAMPDWIGDGAPSRKALETAVPSSNFFLF